MNSHVELAWTLKVRLLGAGIMFPSHLSYGCPSCFATVAHLSRSLPRTHLGLLFLSNAAGCILIPASWPQVLLICKVHSWGRGGR